MRFLLVSVVLLASARSPLGAQRASSRSVDVSAAISDVRYEVAFDRTRARTHTLRVTTRFLVLGSEPVLLSLPAWTPGAYELSNFARLVSGFTATGDDRPLHWDKLDYDTWRITPNGSKQVTVAFDFLADSLDNAMAWTRDDFAFFNGTNLFLYPEGRDAGFSATVTIETEVEWKVATGMSSAAAPLPGTPRRYSASSYHDLVDMPFFVGAFDVDSQQVQAKWVRLASYPAGQLAGQSRRDYWDQVQRMFPPMHAVMGETPYDTYTILTLFDSSSTGGSALEHSNSHVGIYSPFIVGNTAFPSITAHEIFHLWNVKRMRPVDMTPYRYDRAMPTTWLWMSEGITDYYADLALVRGGIVDSTEFLTLTNGKIEEVAAAPTVALEDASLSTWIHPSDGTGYLYYPKGSLAGFMLDVLIRDESDNGAGLDDVMREVYQKSYKAGKGFTAQEWWSAVSRAAKGRNFADFNTQYIDGRSAFPWATILPLAGLKLKVDSLKEPRLGVFTAMDSAGQSVKVTELEPGGAAEEAGVKVGDALISVGDISVNEGFGPRFRNRYGRAEGQSVPIRVQRGSETVALTMNIRVSISTRQRVMFDAAASPKAMRVRRGILTGITGR